MLPTSPLIPRRRPQARQADQGDRTMQWPKRLIPVLGASALLAASAVPALAQAVDDTPIDLQTRVDEFVGLVEGGAAVVTIHDGVVSTAAAGIADAAGDPMTVDTPMLVGPAAASMIYALALQLVDAGQLDLDAPVVSYLPDAPVGDGATVRQLLESRAGQPRVVDALDEIRAEDPDRSLTTDDMVDLIDRSAIVPAGSFSPGYAGTLLTIQLIEAVTGMDVGAALQQHITGPLGLSGTVHPDRASDTPTGVAGGWTVVGDGADLSYVTDEWEAMRSSRPTVSTAADLAAFLSAYLDGRVVSPELQDETVWNEDVETLGYGLLRQDELFPTAGPLGARYFGMDDLEASGVVSTLAVAPSTGDIVVALSNSWALDTSELARDIVQSWAPDPLASSDLSEAAGTYRYTILFTCAAGPSPFDLPPCEMDGAEIHLTFEGVAELTGTFEGSMSLSGDWIENTEDHTFHYSGRGKYLGDVEGCGSGTAFYSNEGEGFRDETGTQNYTRNTTTFLPGGSLPLAGSYDSPGAEVNNVDDTTSGVYAGSYTCG
jgi:D-alanyl-D-alanine carboxypeptidase